MIYKEVKRLLGIKPLCSANSFGDKIITDSKSRYINKPFILTEGVKGLGTNYILYPRDRGIQIDVFKIQKNGIYYLKKVVCRKLDGLFIYAPDNDDLTKRITIELEKHYKSVS